MPVRNAERFLEEALASIALQTFTDFELIVVIDASTDGSEEIARGAARRDARIRIAGNCGLGLVDALNTGCRLAEGALLARLDSDDRMHATRLGRQHDFLNAHPDVVALGTPAIVIDDASRPIGHIGVPRSDLALRARLVRSNPFVHSSMMLRRSAVIAAGGYRDAFPFVEDLDLWLRLARYGKLANLEEPLVDYRRHPDAVSAKYDELQRLALRSCILAWQCREGLVNEKAAAALRHDLTSFAYRIKILDRAPAELQPADLLLFRRLLPHLGGSEARRLLRMVADALNQGQIGRAVAIRFGLATAASRLAFDLRSRRSARRLSRSRVSGEHSNR
jgi:glycosyltransferase involved in cell wall biosynthesis